MFHARRFSRGFLLATLALLTGHSASAQRAFRNAVSRPPTRSSALRQAPPECIGSGDPVPASRYYASGLGRRGCEEVAARTLPPPVELFKPRPEENTVLSGLQALGRKGRSILAARAYVLEILASENACTVWFREGAGDPAATFSTLSFNVDSKTVDYVIERTDDGRLEAFVNPYVAAVVQDGGEYQAIILNAGGAFFHSAAKVVRLAKGGGPLEFHGFRRLNVGPYMGDTLQARLTTMLHELGHVLGLLPLDTNDVNGQSAANTAQVVRHCGAEIEAASKPPLLAGSR